MTTGGLFTLIVAAVVVAGAIFFMLKARRAEKLRRRSQTHSNACSAPTHDEVARIMHGGRGGGLSA